MPDKRFPLEYRTVHLYDELKYLALREELDKLQNSGQASPTELQKLSSKIAVVLQEAELKRDAFYSKQSVNAFFGIRAHLRKEGFFGKILAFLLNPSAYFKYFKS